MGIHWIQKWCKINGMILSDFHHSPQITRCKPYRWFSAARNGVRVGWNSYLSDDAATWQVKSIWEFTFAIASSCAVFVALTLEVPKVFCQSQMGKQPPWTFGAEKWGCSCQLSSCPAVQLSLILDPSSCLIKQNRPHSCARKPLNRFCWHPIIKCSSISTLLLLLLYRHCFHESATLEPWCTITMLETAVVTFQALLQIRSSPIWLLWTTSFSWPAVNHMVNIIMLRVPWGGD